MHMLTFPRMHFFQCALVPPSTFTGTIDQTFDKDCCTAEVNWRDG